MNDNKSLSSSSYLNSLQYWTSFLASEMILLLVFLFLSDQLFSFTPQIPSIPKMVVFPKFHPDLNLLP